eukprot:211065-Pyramimonas_sp.AAC.1
MSGSCRRVWSKPISDRMICLTAWCLFAEYKESFGRGSGRRPISGVSILQTSAPDLFRSNGVLPTPQLAYSSN